MPTEKEAVLIPESKWMLRRNQPPAPSRSHTTIPRMPIS